MHPPSLAVPEKYIKVEGVETSLFRRDRLNESEVEVANESKNNQNETKRTVNGKRESWLVEDLFSERENENPG